MTVRTGLAVARDGSSNGTTPRGFRVALGGLLAKTNAGGIDVRKGILWDGLGAVVTGTAGMAYSVRACNAVVMPSAVQGPIIVPNDAALSVSTTAAPGSNSRIDVIWVRQHLTAADGGADSDVIGEWGVTQGTAAASPTAPAIPTGAVEIARATVPTGTTNTNALTISQTHLWTAPAGAPVPVRSDAERAALAYDGSLVNHLGSDTLQRYDGASWLSVGGNPNAAGTGTSPAIGVAYQSYLTAIVFPVGRFAVPPAVTASFVAAPLSSTVDQGIWVQDITTAGANVGVRRSATSGGGLGFTWTAIEPG